MSMMRPDPALLANADVGGRFANEFSPEPPLRSLDPARIWLTIVRRRKLFMLVAIPLFALVVLFTILQKTQYATNVRLLAGAANSDSSPVQSSAGSTDLSILNAFIAARGSQTPETYIDLLLQPTIATDVAQKININASVKDILKAVKALPVPDTAIISLTATWSDPKTSAEIARSLGGKPIRS
jgi:uncharacterized protein involved in exopolysaccharide biosynthesis